MNLLRKCLVAGAVSSLLMSSVGVWAQAAPTTPAAVPVAPVATPKPPELRMRVDEPFVFAAFGDLRETETNNHTSSDPERRQAIIKAMSDLNPSFILVSGDLTLSGANAQDWNEWDQETAEWKKKQIPVLPVLGNHDVNGGLSGALKNYFDRFPLLQQNRYYSARTGHVQIFCLDSTQPTASGPQFDWLKDKLGHLPKEIDFVVFLIHHPPLTHSSDRLFGGGHSTRPSEMALGHWLEEMQGKSSAKFVVIAGHVHNYERYERNQVLYIVSGGGGATPYEIKRSDQDGYKDQGPSYHYLRISVNGSQMRIGMEKLQMINGKAFWNERDMISLTGANPHGAEKPSHTLPKDQ